MFKRISQAVSNGSPLIVEGNFKRKHTARLRGLLSPETKVVGIYCFANGWVPYKRYVARMKSGERHWGHRDYLWVPRVWRETLLSQIGIVRFAPLELGGDILKVDATDFSNVDFSAIETEVRSRLT